MELALRRGGQPRNQNALTHGLYSSRNLAQQPGIRDASTPGEAGGLHPIHAARLRVKQTIKLLPLSSRRQQILSIQANLAHLRDVLRLSSETGLLAPTPRAFISYDRGFQRAWTTTLRASETLRKRLDELDHLPRLASRAWALYTWEFNDRGIPTVGLPAEPVYTPLLIAPADPDASPPLGRADIQSAHLHCAAGARSASHVSPTRAAHPRSEAQGAAPWGAGANEPSDSGNTDISFLTSAQWTLIEPILTSFRQEQAEYAALARAGSSLASPNSPLPAKRPSRSTERAGLGEGSGVRDQTLLNLLLLKLAFGFTWSDLPQDLPVRAARKLYRQLYLSGRMAAIYTLLHHHLDTEGSRTLDDIAESDALTIEGRLVVPTFEEDLTWEVRTALLLLQRALFNERKQQRRDNLERRSRGLYLRAGSLHLLPPRLPSSKIPPLHAADPQPFHSSQNRKSKIENSKLRFVPLALGKNDNFTAPEGDSGPPLPRYSDGEGREYHPLEGAGRRPLGGFTPILSNLGLKPDT